MSNERIQTFAQQIATDRDFVVHSNRTTEHAIKEILRLSAAAPAEQTATEKGGETFEAPVSAGRGSFLDAVATLCAKYDISANDSTLVRMRILASAWAGAEWNAATEQYAKRIAELMDLAVCGVVTGSAFDRSTGITDVDVCENQRPCAAHPADAWLIERNRADGAEERIGELERAIDAVIQRFDAYTAHALDLHVLENAIKKLREVRRG